LTAWKAMSCLSYFHAHTSHMQRWAEQPGHSRNFKFWQYTWHIVDILQNKYPFMRSEVPTLVIVRITIFEHMTSCHLLETDKHFEGNNCLQFQNRICREQFSPICWYICSRAHGIAWHGITSQKTVLYKNNFP
jgi:hypothetical protein